MNYIDQGIASNNFWEKLFAHYYLLKQKSYLQKDLIYLRGSMLDYIRTCTDSHVTFDSFIETEGNSDIFGEKAGLKTNLFLHQIIEYQFGKELEEAKKNSQQLKKGHELLILAHVQFLIEISKRTYASIVALCSLQTTSLLTDYSKYKLFRLIDDMEYESDRKAHEITLLKLQKAEQRLRIAITEEVGALSALWSYASVQQPDIDQVETLIRQALKKAEEVRVLWTEIESHNIHLPSLYYLFASYMEKIHGDYIYGNRFRFL